MKLISTVYKNRKLNIPNHTAVSFDSNGICDLPIDQKEAEYLCSNILYLKIYEDGDETLTKEKKEDVIQGKTNPINSEVIDENKKALAEDMKNTEAEKAKLEAIDNVNSIKSLKTLKTLAEEFDKAEWENFKTIEQLKTYLISKI